MRYFYEVTFPSLSEIIHNFYNFCYPFLSFLYIFYILLPFFVVSYKRFF